MTAKGYFQLSESLRESPLTRWIPRVERVPGGLFRHSAYIADMNKTREGAAIPLLQRGTLALNGVNKAKVRDRAQTRYLFL